MNKDPLEELFGSFDETPEPVPARERLAHEQAERVRTAQLPAERSATRSTSTLPRDDSDAGRNRSSSAKPWIIVGIVAVVAILASIVVLNLARGGGDEPTPTAGPTTQAPTTTEAPKPTPTPSEKPETDKPDEDEPPAVDVGDTYGFPITQWNATSQWPVRLGGATYALSGADNAELRLSGELFNSFPDACAAMRTEWGASRQPDGSFAVAKPASKCTAAPELYDEVWGLLNAWVGTMKAG
ncbi:hypothetical protein FM113_00675 [Leucobacter sp. 7(1)]|uniref:hypothetical protein n=1 Tax=Leucobacter sp. 7(1) TaxID=1255613 RepID=UPI00097EABF7|nr:hypothetical protein [Leucobacter sp. 7(1)]SJN08059.1 hypothetical protein FM113_00675 [Leucobacter sp. 7(1)]